MKIDRIDNIGNSYKIKPLLNMISDHNATKLEIKNIKLKKSTSIWNIKNLLKVQMEIKWKVQTEIKKCLKNNNDGDTINQNL